VIKPGSGKASGKTPARAAKANGKDEGGTHAESD